LSDPETKPKSKKIFNEIYTQKSMEFKDKRLKVFPEKLVTYNMAKIISHNANGEDLKISSDRKVIEYYLN
jgi:hypothetical protein